MDLTQEMEMILAKIIEEFNYKIKTWNFRTGLGFNYEKLKSSNKKQGIIWNKTSNFKNKFDK